MFHTRFYCFYYLYYLWFFWLSKFPVQFWYTSFCLPSSQLFQIQGGCLLVKIRAAVCFSLLLAPFFHVLVNNVKPIKWCVDCYRYPARGTFKFSTVCCCHLYSSLFRGQSFLHPSSGHTGLVPNAAQW